MTASPTPLQTQADAARSGCVVVPQPDAALLTLTGEDVRRWTNGMFTNTTKTLAPGQGNRHAWCNDRGRVQGVLDLYLVTEDRVLLVLEGGTVDHFAGHFRMYLMLDDIELDDLAEPDEGPPCQLLSLVGPETGTVLAAAGLGLPPGDHQHALFNGVRVCRRDRTGHGGADLIVPADRVAALTAALAAAGATAATPAVIDALQVVAGRAAWPADGTEKSLVHELRLNTDCCNFQKGCYVGQEVINRVDVRGAVQKKLTAVVLDAPVAPGAAVSLDGAALGTLTRVAQLDGRHHAVGVLRKAAWPAGTVLAVDGGATATVVGLD